MQKLQLIYILFTANKNTLSSMHNIYVHYKSANMTTYMHTQYTFGKERRPWRKVGADMSLRASDHDGFAHGFSGSAVTGSRCRWNSSSTQSMILMMRWGGLASLRTVSHNNHIEQQININLQIACV